MRVLNTLVSAIALLGLSACDAAKPSEPAAEAAAPVAPAAPQALDGATLLAAVDAKILCAMFARASTDTAVTVEATDCAPSATSTSVVVKTIDGKTALDIPLVQAGSVVTLNANNASARAVKNDVYGTFSNLGVVMIGKAPATGLCVSVESFAPDGGSNSAYMLVAGAKTDRLESPVNPKALGQASYPTAVVPANQTAPFAITRREPGFGIKSITLKAC